MNAKQLGFFGLACAPFLGAMAQQNIPTPAPIPVQAVSRDANSCLWQGEIAVTNEDGKVWLSTNSYVELATGLNYVDPATGQWTPSVEEIDLVAGGGAIADKAQHQVQFPADIGAGDVVITMPDGTVLSTHPAGLAYFDGDKSVLIARLTNSVGLLLGNTVVYTNCLVGSDFTASVRYTFTKAGLEQEVILPPEQLPDGPEAFGLNASNSFLLVLSQFTNAPAPTKTTRQIMRGG